MKRLICLIFAVAAALRGLNAAHAAAVLPFDPAAPNALITLQTVLPTPAGRALNPFLPADFGTRLDAALKAPAENAAELETLRAEAAQAYAETAPLVKDFLHELVLQFPTHEPTQAEILERTLAEMRPYGFFGQDALVEIAAVETLAQAARSRETAARSDRTLEGAQHVAAEILPDDPEIMAPESIPEWALNWVQLERWRRQVHKELPLQRLPADEDEPVLTTILTPAAANEQTVKASELLKDLYDLSMVLSKEHLARLKTRARDIRREDAQLSIIYSIADTTPYSHNLAHNEILLGFVSDIAVRSSSQRVKNLALQTLRYERRRQNKDPRYNRFLDERINALYKAADRSANIPVLGLGKQFITGVVEHPLGAVFGGLALSNLVLRLVDAAFPPLGIALILLPLLYAGVKGLWHDRPVATFFQLLILADLFYKTISAGAALTAGPILLLAAGGLAGVAVAAWSFRNNRPVLGWALNLALVWALQAVLLGTPWVVPLLQIAYKGKVLLP